MLKKTILLITALLLILTVSACSSDAPSDGDKNDSQNKNSGARFEIDTSENLFGEGVSPPHQVTALAGGYEHSANLGLKAWQSPPTLEPGNTADVYSYAVSGYTMAEVFDFYKNRLSDYTVNTVEENDAVKYIEFSTDSFAGVVDLSLEDGQVSVAFWIYYNM